jgi:hypothetical protein
MYNVDGAGTVTSFTSSCYGRCHGSFFEVAVTVVFSIIRTKPFTAVGAPAPAASARPPMRWSSVNSRFILGRICELVGRGARGDKGFKEVHVVVPGASRWATKS